MGVRELARVLVAVALALSLGPTDAGAEGFVDAYLGQAITDDENVDIEIQDFGFLVRATVDTEFDDSLSGGFRIGYWLDPIPWLGFAADVSAFAPDADLPPVPLLPVEDANITVVPFSALLMLRVPIASSEKMPGGRMQPYGAIGPSLFVSAIDVDEPGFGEVTAVTADFGLDARVGLRLLALDWLAFFAEYRYTRVHPNWEDSVSGVDVDIDTRLETHHLTAGFGVHF